MSPRVLLMGAAAVFAATVVTVGQQADAFHESANHPAIAYTTAPVNDAVASLNRKLAAGEIRFARDAKSGYLQATLDALKIPVESQMLVFSQTSLQASEIAFQNPRAIYFNDTVDVGWVRGADLLEVSALDPRQGVIFYTLDQRAGAPTRFTRETQCLECHLTWDTLAVPGLTATSSYPLANENAYANGFTTDDRSPLSERWGGWFVTGQHPTTTRHMGNVPVAPRDKGRSKIANPRAPLASLQGQFDLTGYPTPYSDVVPLLVFDHQTRMTNLIIRVGWEARVAAASKDMTRVREAAALLVDYMLFGDEAPLPGRIRGTAGFEARFTAAGPRDSKGRSLRDFDLERRLFRYPCSYMIYSEAFDALPPAARDAVYSRLFAILSGTVTSPALKRLTASDRQAILEILRETKKDLPPSFG